MKLLSLFIIVGCLQVSAKSFSQQVTLSAQNTPLKSVFQEIEKQTGFLFLYDKQLVSSSKPVSVSLSNVPLDEALRICLKDQKLAFNIEEKTIVISAAPTTSKSNSPGEFLPPGPIKIRVSGADGQALAGASITIKNSKNSGVTDAEGVSTINADVGDVITISYVGFASESFTIKDNSSTLSISLKPSTNPLDEVHVIAYGTTTQRLSTGNTSTVKAEDIANQPVANPLLTLQGRVPGIFITQTSGLSGSGVTVKVQGQNSIQKGNDPFYVVDGVPYTSQLMPTLSDVLGNGGTNGTDHGAGNPFSYLNPADIENIEVLKDADATAIYGSRAANGAILITTKKGQTGQTRIDFSIQQGIGQVAHKMHMLNTDQYLEMRKEAYKNDGTAIPTPASNKTSSNYDLTVWDQNRYTDWQNELIGGKANFTDMQAGISGGSSLTTFRLNGGLHRETTVFPMDFADVKGSVGINVNHTSANQKFQVQFSSNYLIDNNKLPTADLTASAYLLSPNAPALFHSDGTLNWERIKSGADSVSTWINPLSNGLNAYQNRARNLISNLNFSYTFLSNLVFKTSLGYTDLNTKETLALPIIAYRPEQRDNNSRIGQYGNGGISSWIIEPQLSYGFHIAKGQGSLLIGSTFQENNNDLQQIIGTGFTSDGAIKDMNSASTLTQGGFRILSTYKYNAFFSRLNYNWENKYVLNLTARRDGSSRFGPENQFHNFGAIGAAWIFSEERFSKKLIPFLSYGKLRGSYGTTGNDQIGDYGFLNQYSVVVADMTYQGGTGIQPTKHPNPYLEWELTKKLQFGLDLGFVKDRIVFGANYFRNRSNSQLLTYSLPFQTGFGEVFRNFPATIQNIGWEFTLLTSNLRLKNITWTSNINFTTNKNKLVEFPNLSESTYASSLLIGEPIGVFKKFNFAGVDSKTGLYQFYSADGKIVSTPSPTSDNTIIYTSDPKFYGGLQNSISYKYISLDFLFQFVKTNAGNYRLGSGRGRVGNATNQPIEVLDRWQKEGDIATIQKYSNSKFIFDAQNSNYSQTDASYIKLKNLSLSYTLPLRWMNSINFQKCRIYLQGQNLLTITKYVGPDPENPDINSLPPLRVIAFGLNITL